MTLSLINSYVESKFQFSGFNRLLVINRSILIFQKFQTKTKVLYYALSRSTNYRANGTYIFTWELTANNFYRRNCVDLKPVPIIRFIFQFGFRIVWDSDPSRFGILKCPSLASSHSNYVVYTASCRGTKVSYRIWLCSHSSWCFLKQPTSFGARPHQQFVGCAAEISATYDWNCRGHIRNVPSNPCYSKWLSGLKIFVAT